MFWKGLFLVAGAFLLTTSMTEAKEFFVSPTGDDENPGTEERPFATLHKAQQEVKSLREGGWDRDVRVILREGTYRLESPLVLGLEDTGGEKQTLTYAAYEGERPVLSGTVPVGDWEHVGDGVWVTDLSWAILQRQDQPAATGMGSSSQPLSRILSVYRNETRLPRAKGEGFSPTAKEPRTQEGRMRLSFPEKAVGDWKDLQEAELSIVPSHFWIHNLLPIDSVDLENHNLRTQVMGTYPLGKNAMSDRPACWIENSLGVLDERNEWVFHTEEKKLYLQGEEDSPPEDVYIPLLTELVRLEGQIDEKGPHDQPVRGIIFEGITFTGGDRLPWAGGTGWGLQHDWERFDSPTALLRLRGAEDCEIRNCSFENSGHTGLRLDLHCQNILVKGNQFHHLGGVGILLCGYGPGTKDVNKGNRIEDNEIHHIGELYWASPGVFVWQSGENQITHNTIHHTPYTGLVVSGRIQWDPKGIGECSRTVRWKEIGIDPNSFSKGLSWAERERFLHGRKNLIFRNEIHHAMEVTGDGNCVYISGTGGGNVVRENYCHHCQGNYMNAVLRCDDDQHQTLMEGNILFQTQGHGEGIISKGDNDLVNNFIIDLQPTAKHRGYIVFPYGDVSGSLIERNVFYSTRKGQLLYGEGHAKGALEAPRLHHTEANCNLYFCTEDPAWAEKHIQEERKHGIEKHSLSADPLFVDLEEEDFSLSPDSPAFKLGIQAPIDIKDVGVRSHDGGR